MHSATKGRSVLVTGASKGLGLETALALAENGFTVWAGMRDPGAYNAATEASRRNVSLKPIQLDVTDDESVQAAIRRIGQEGGLYGLVNNAGVTARCCFEDFPEEKIRQIFEVNLFGPMRVTRCALPLLRQTGEGRIVMVSSIGGRIGSTSVAPYTSSKFGLEGFAESLSLELKFFNIGVTIVEPGMVKTTIWDENRIMPEAHNRESPYYKLFWSAERMAEAVLNSSTLRPADVATAVVRAMSAKNPKLRMVVGRRAGLVLAFRRLLFGGLFEKLYFGGQERMIRKRMEKFVMPERPGSVIGEQKGVIR